MFGHTVFAAAVQGTLALVCHANGHGFLAFRKCNYDSTVFGLKIVTQVTYVLLLNFGANFRMEHPRYLNSSLVVSLNFREPYSEVRGKILPSNFQHGEVSSPRQLQAFHHWNGGHWDCYWTHTLVECVFCTIYS